MPRKLKTYVTSVGFFDQAIAAPSMKAALEAWGAGKNSFHHGFAEETDDPGIIAATMAKPGVVLRRAVGTKDPFTENAELPKSLPATAPKRARKAKSRKAIPRKKKGGKKGPAAEVISLAEKREAKRAASEYEKEAARREREEEKKEAARQKERERRDVAIGVAEAALEKAKKRHGDAMEEIATERERLDRREEDEGARWDKEKEKLEAALRHAGD